MIEPALADDAFLADVERMQITTERGACVLWWLGQSGFLVQHRGGRFLIDPYLSDSLTKKYANTDKPHVRMTRRVVDPARLLGIDFVSASHDHTDHLDAETLRPLVNNNPRMKLVFPEHSRTLAAERIGRAPNDSCLVGIDGGQKRALGSVTLHALPAAHEIIERDDQGRCRFLGFVFEIEQGVPRHSGQGATLRIFHSGDTFIYE